MFVICSIIKDEHKYIREWILHNRKIGFDKIILYDNNSSKPYDDVIGDMLQEGYISLIPWNDITKERQINAYNDFIRSKNWDKNDWCAFIDPDEYIFFDESRTVSEFIELYAGFAGVGLSWRMYNANGHIKSPEGLPIVEAYKNEVPYFEPGIKIIGRLIDISEFRTPHIFTPARGVLVTTSGQPILSQDPKYKSYINGHIKHYFTKSWEDWVKRLKRGDIIKGYRNVNTFFEYNPDMLDIWDELTKDLNFEEFPSIGNPKKPDFL